MLVSINRDVVLLRQAIHSSVDPAERDHLSYMGKLFFLGWSASEIYDLIDEVVRSNQTH